MNRFIFPILFGGILLVCIFGLMLFQQMGGEIVSDGASADNSEIETENSRDGSGIMFALQMMYEDMTGAAVVTPKIDVSGFVPEAPNGWFPTPYKNADGEAITQTTLSRGPIAKNATNTMLMQFDGLARGKGNGFAVTYKRGEQMIAYMMYVPDQFNSRTVRGGIMAAISSNMSAASFGGSPDTFALHHGVPISAAPSYVRSQSSSENVPVDYRVFNANVGGMFKIKILTNSSYAAVAKVMQAIPMGALIAKLPEPEPHLLISTDFQTRDAELSAEVPVSPSIARRAYMMSKVRLDYSDLDTDLLDDIMDRRVRDWETAFEDHGTALGVEAEIRALLGEMPDLPPSLAVEYNARALKRMDRDWTDNEETILSKMARRQITERKHMERYLRDGEHISEEIITLINLLPETYDAASLEEPVIVESPISARDLVIRRGTKIGQGESTFGNCSIEHGVRRCVVGGLDDN